jgi:hypothetical protein
VEGDGDANYNEGASTERLKTIIEAHTGCLLSLFRFKRKNFCGIKVTNFEKWRIIKYRRG